MFHSLLRRGAAAASITASFALGARQPDQCEEDRLARWAKRWDAPAQGWALGRRVHPRLAAHESALLPNTGRARVLVPLSGASHDVAYLAWEGHQVVAVDGVRAARDAFVEEYGASTVGDRLVSVFRPGRVRILGPDGSGRASVAWREGDFLAFGEGGFDAAFDRGGLVAVVPEDREAYVAVLRRALKPGGRVLFVSVEHPPFGDGRLGPPHSLDESEVRRLFGGAFDVKQLAREDRMGLEPAWAERGCSYFYETT
eukprot:CAMPEP_0119292722 /NCGR_PEP_ID=MMETSP1329-20130426/44710_1 /TAXON_ID=114041 /ORGANISM="Genus nov. species nov., Strain RCC1024" /LENGTH=255 /DNA_ID=CAMNT_0007293567 /DNA_START=176 /DNA_END=939 /DNA_ORIENTATION=+